MPVEIITKEDVREEFRNCFLEVKDEISEIVKKGQRKPFLNTQDLIEMGLSYTKQQYMRDSGQIGYVQEGRKILYPVEELERWAEEHAVNLKFDNHE